MARRHASMDRVCSLEVYVLGDYLEGFVFSADGRNRRALSSTSGTLVRYISSIR